MYSKDSEIDIAVGDGVIIKTPAQFLEAGWFLENSEILNHSKSRFYMRVSVLKKISDKICQVVFLDESLKDKNFLIEGHESHFFTLDTISLVLPKYFYKRGG
jgi:hypothetical protein